MKLESSRRTFEKWSSIKFHENPYCGSRVVPCVETHRLTDGRTDRHMTELLITFLQFLRTHLKRTHAWIPGSTWKYLPWRQGYQYWRRLCVLCAAFVFSSCCIMHSDANGYRLGHYCAGRKTLNIKSRMGISVQFIHILFVCENRSKFGIYSRTGIRTLCTVTK
jgi:hypothetical protein